MQVKASGPSDGIEPFPKQDRIERTQFGNAIRAPLGIHRAVSRRYWFYGAQHDLEAQMRYLRELRRVTERQLSDLIAGLVLEEERQTQPSACTRTDRSYFQILAHLDPEGLRRESDVYPFVLSSQPVNVTGFVYQLAHQKHNYRRQRRASSTDRSGAGCHHRAS